MQCPKCGFEQPDDRILCDSCGIVFEKYYKYHPRPGEAADQRARAPDPVPRPARHPRRAPSEPSAEAWRSLLLPETQTGDWVGLAARTALWAVLVVWGGSLMLSSIASNAVGQSFLHNVNLPFHEFGHILFRPFGQYVASLGGTLGQLLMPSICAGVLLLSTRDPFGASAAVWWLGENFLDIAPYIDDARAGQLPLLGGNFGHSAPYGFHDWEYLLGETGLSHLDHAIARGSHLLGCLIMVLALSWGGWLLFRHYRQLEATS